MNKIFIFKYLLSGAVIWFLFWSIILGYADNGLEVIILFAIIINPFLIVLIPYFFFAFLI